MKYKGAFWGILLIFLGLMFILRAFFNISIPIFRLAIGLTLIYWGIETLSGIITKKRKQEEDN